MDEIINKIKQLKAKRNAIILAHNYQRPEIQDIADFCGDSLGLSLEASKTNADVIVFCGVHFMAETAAILCPQKTVLIPDENAGCPMANMITVRELYEIKQRHPEAIIVTYVNSSAKIKAESDYCCTSSNAIKLVNSIPEEREIIFIPDKSLGSWVTRHTSKKMILWSGYCPSHHRIRQEDVKKMKIKFPNALVVVHPECTTEVIDLADKVASTTGILEFCKQSSAKEFLIGTEIGIIHRLRKENPDKTFYPITDLADCPDMKLNTLEKVLWCLEEMAPQVAVPHNIATKAEKAIKRMLEIV